MSRPEYTDPKGRVWNEYVCSFTSPDGSYSFHIWALSHDHALLQLAALKETAKVDGRVEGVIEA